MSNANFRPRKRERGLALVFVLLMMTIAMTAALFAARSTLLGDKASQNDRDRQIAFQAAELALGDAELDIMDATLALKSGSISRACKLGSTAGAMVAEPGCSKSSATRGLCGLNAESFAAPSKPMYAQIKEVNWDETDDAKRAYVRYGEFTGRSSQFATGDSKDEVMRQPKPAMPPKYIIVQAPGKPQIMVAGKPFKMEAAFKVYAVGYGSNPKTKVMLEGDFYKPVLEKSCAGAAS